jgi:hypothetical protein
MIGQLRGRLLGGVQVCIKGLDVAQPAQAKRRAVAPRPCRGHGAGDDRPKSERAGRLRPGASSASAAAPARLVMQAAVLCVVAEQSRR